MVKTCDVRIKPHEKPQLEENSHIMYILCRLACLIIQGVKITLNPRVATARRDGTNHTCVRRRGRQTGVRI